MWPNEQNKFYSESELCPHSHSSQCISFAGARGIWRTYLQKLAIKSLSDSFLKTQFHKTMQVKSDGKNWVNTIYITETYPVGPCNIIPLHSTITMSVGICRLKVRGNLTFLRKLFHIQGLELEDYVE